MLKLSAVEENDLDHLIIFIDGRTEEPEKLGDMCSARGIPRFSSVDPAFYKHASSDPTQGQLASVVSVRGWLGKVLRKSGGASNFLELFLCLPKVRSKGFRQKLLVSGV